MGVQNPYQSISLSYFIGSLLQPPLRAVDSPIALIDVLLHVPKVVVLESPFRFLLGVGGLVLCLQAFVVQLGTWTEILFGVGEQIVRACANKIGAAHLHISYRNLGSSSAGSTHELLAHELFCDAS